MKNALLDIWKKVPEPVMTLRFGEIWYSWDIGKFGIQHYTTTALFLLISLMFLVSPLSQLNKLPTYLEWKPSFFPMYLHREAIEKCQCVRTKCWIMEPGSNAILNFACLLISSAIIVTFVAIYALLSRFFKDKIHACFVFTFCKWINGLQWRLTHCLTLMR